MELTIIGHLGVPKITWYIVLQHGQCDVCILPGAHHGVFRLHSVLGLLHGHGRIEGPDSGMERFSESCSSEPCPALTTYMHSFLFMPQKNSVCRR